METPQQYKWTDEDTGRLISWRGENEALFTGRRNAAVKGFETFLKDRGMEGKVEAAFVKKKWENLKQKYKELKAPRTGVSTEGGEATAVTWKWFGAMDEVFRRRDSWDSVFRELDRRELQAEERAERAEREAQEREERIERERREEDRRSLERRERE